MIDLRRSELASCCQIAQAQEAEIAATRDPALALARRVNLQQTLDHIAALLLLPADPERG